MPIRIVKDLLPDDHPLETYPMEPKYIIVHNTANPAVGADALMHARYIRSQSAIASEVLWHYSVDDKRVVQHWPTSRNGWHASDGYNGDGNRKGIAIEICENADGDIRKAEENAAELCAYLIKNEPALYPFPTCMKQHHDFARDGKNCPHILRDRPNGWEGFVKLVEQKLNATEWNPADEVQKLMDRGIIDTWHNPNAMPSFGELATMLNRVLDMMGK